MTKEQLLEKANDLPLAPGVYLMMDASGKVIYVGKAKKLKNRVSQYFQLGTGHNEKTRRMVSQVDHFDTIFVSSEFEALILENSLIKHRPRCPSAWMTAAACPYGIPRGSCSGISSTPMRPSMSTRVPRPSLSFCRTRPGMPALTLS